jgi:hypothetical protein
MCLKTNEIIRFRGASCPPPNLKLACFDRLTRQIAKAKDLIKKKELVEGLRFGGYGPQWTMIPGKRRTASLWYAPGMPCQQMPPGRRRDGSLIDHLAASLLGLYAGLSQPATFTPGFADGAGFKLTIRTGFICDRTWIIFKSCCPAVT